MAPLWMTLPMTCAYRNSDHGPPRPFFTKKFSNQLDLFPELPCCKNHGFSCSAEPICQSLLAEDEVFRFHWQRSDDPPYKIRIGRKGSRVGVISETWGFGIPKEEWVVKRALSLEQWAELKIGLRRAKFWTSESDFPGGGLDGATWTIEGREGGRFHCIRRWSPRDGAFRDLGLLFLEFAGLQIAVEDVY